MVEERSHCSEVGPARAGGAMGSENAGTSSTTAGESPARRKPEVSRATSIVPGLVGPKASLSQGRVTDGQQVNIPALGSVCYRMRVLTFLAFFGYGRSARKR